MKNVLRLLFFSFYSVVFATEFWSLGTIHVLGDSHAPFCFTIENSFHDFRQKKNLFLPDTQHSEAFQYEYFCKNNIINIPFQVHWIGPRTMHRVGRDGLNGLNVKELVNTQKGDVVVYVFGEIDVRRHILYQVFEKKRKQEEVINTLVKNYIDTIEENTKFSQTLPIVFSVPPPSTQPSKKSLKQPYTSANLRIQVTKQLNQKLQQVCQEHNILCLNINDEYATPKGYLQPKKSGGVHISPDCNDYIKKALITLLLKNMTKY